MNRARWMSKSCQGPYATRHLVILVACNGVIGLRHEPEHTAEPRRGRMTGVEPRHRALRSSSLFRQKRNDPVDKNGDGPLRVGTLARMPYQGA